MWLFDLYILNLHIISQDRGLTLDKVQLECLVVQKKGLYLTFIELYSIIWENDYSIQSTPDDCLSW